MGKMIGCSGSIGTYFQSLEAILVITPNLILVTERR